jgi:hypothetical protein
VLSRISCIALGLALLEDEQKFKKVSLVCCYYFVCYLSNSVDYSPPRSSSGLPMLMCFLIFHRLTRKHLSLLMDVVSGFESFSEAPRLA